MVNHKFSEMPSYKEITVEIKPKLAIITLNRPDKRNAINSNMYLEVTKALKELSENGDISITAITGAGDYYSSGTDILDSIDFSSSNMKQAFSEASAKARNLTAAFIDHKKILVGVVNGPAIGIAVSTLALCDVVYCSETATFQTPFSNLGLVAEACSSYTFPLIMGYSKANEMLLFNHKMTAKEAKEVGLVADIYTKDELYNQLWPQLEKHANELPMKSLICSKRLMRHFNRTQLHEANRIEGDRILERLQSEDASNAVMNFMSSKKSKI